MKKRIALLLSVLMLLSLTACGEKKPAADPKVQTTAPETQPALSGKTITTNLLTLTYDDALWTYDEEDLGDYEDYVYLELIIPDEEDEDSYITSVVIDVSVEDHQNFREYLETFEFDAYKYAEENGYELVKIGGIDCLKKETENWGEDRLVYLGRDEAASATVFIDICGEITEENVEKLLAGLTVTAKNIRNTDAPWPWNGEPFSSDGGEQPAGPLAVSSRWIPITDCIMTSETFDHAIAVDGDKVYILGDEILRRYAFDGEKLTYEKDIAIDGDFKNIQRTEDGTVWISGFMLPLVSLRDGVQTGSYEGTDYVVMHPSGAWGISYFSGAECEKITLSDGNLQTSKLTFAGVSTISTLHIDEDYIYVCGYADDDSGHKVFVYDHSGSLLMTLTDEDGDSLGSITFMAQTDFGLLGMDGNMRQVILWSGEGVWIDSVEDGDLFETDYPWFCGGTRLDDGSVLVIMTDDRADGSATELVAFKVAVS